MAFVPAGVVLETVWVVRRRNRIPKTEVETRSVSRVSVMPDAQEATMSRREFVDLIAYLQTLK